MERLPYEVIDQIVDYLPERKLLAPLATLSRHWKWEIERRVFRRVKLRVSAKRTLKRSPEWCRKRKLPEAERDWE